MRLAFQIASRFLRNAKGQTILIILGIAIGVSVQVFIGLLIQGLQAGLIDKTVGNSSQITLSSASSDGQMDGWQEYYTTVSGIKGIKNVSVSASGSAFLNQEEPKPVLLRGFQMEEANNIYHFDEKLIEGTLPKSPYEVAIGKKLMEENTLSLGDTLTLTTPDGRLVDLNITGIFDLKVASLNGSWLVTSLETSQEVFGYGDRITSIEMQLKDVFQAENLALEVQKTLGTDALKVDNWMIQNEELLSGLNGQSVSSIMIQVFVLLAVVLGIASVLAITALQKSKQLGILKAMGIKDRTASNIFLLEGLMLGVMGAVAGILFGLALCLMFTKFALNPDGTPVVPLYIDGPFIAFSGIIAVLSAMIAAIIPARKSAKLNPIEVIRNG